MTIRVKVVNKRSRKHLILRWRDPDTNAWRERTTHTANRTEAERQAGVLEAELVDGRYREPTRVTWEEVRERHEEEHYPTISERACEGYDTALKAFERAMRPGRLAGIKAAEVSRYEAKLRKRGLRPATIRNYLTHLRGFLNWAVEVGLLVEAPKVKMPKVTGGGKVMRGRPITDGEFQKMLDAVPKVVGELACNAWRYYLEGMWLSGLRRGESFELYWERADRHRVDLDGDWPMLRFTAEFEKGREDRIHPMAPEFAKFLQATPAERRTGPVFQPHLGEGDRPHPQVVGRKVAEMGKAAGIVVDEREGKKKYASLHDLRRSFGARWARRLLPQQLMALMRHKSIETTLQYYVGEDANREAQVIWQAYENENAIAESGKKGDTSAEEAGKLVGPRGFEPPIS